MVNYSNIPYIRHKKQTATETSIVPKVIADYSSLLTEYDFVPSNNQIVVEIDTRKFKTGDGTTLYSNLEYNASSCELTDTITTNTSIPILDEYTNLINLSEAPADGKLIISTSTEITTKMGDGKTDFFNLNDSAPLFIDDEGKEYDLSSMNYDQKVALKPTTKVDVANPILADGELYTAKSFTYSLKIGDGATGFKELAYDDNNIARIPATIFIFDTSSNLSTANLTLDKKRIAVETDTNKIKEGNGITKWNDTMYQKTIEI